MHFYFSYFTEKPVRVKLYTRMTWRAHLFERTLIWCFFAAHTNLPCTTLSLLLLRHCFLQSMYTSDRHLSRTHSHSRTHHSHTIKRHRFLLCMLTHLCGVWYGAYPQHTRPTVATLAEALLSPKYIYDHKFNDSTISIPTHHTSFAYNP